MEYKCIGVNIDTRILSEIDARGKKRSRIIYRDLGRLYGLYAEALRQNPLTTDEACLLVDVLSGSTFDASSAHTLWTKVQDEIALGDLGSKWKVDSTRFVAYLKELTSLECMALIDAAERFWVVALQEKKPSGKRTLVRRFFHIQDEEGTE
jgi:hypothetical protein